MYWFTCSVFSQFVHSSKFFLLLISFWIVNRFCIALFLFNYICQKIMKHLYIKLINFFFFNFLKLILSLLRYSKVIKPYASYLKCKNVIKLRVMNSLHDGIIMTYNKKMIIKEDVFLNITVWVMEWLNKNLMWVSRIQNFAFHNKIFLV